MFMNILIYGAHVYMRYNIDIDLGIRSFYVILCDFSLDVYV